MSSLPIPYFANSPLYLDNIHGLPRFESYENCVVVSCGVTRFRSAFPYSQNILGLYTVKILVEQWFKMYGARTEVHSNEDVRIWSDTRWYKRVLDAAHVHVTTGVPYTHISNPLCKRQNRVVEQDVTVLMKEAGTKDWVSLLSWAL